MSPTELARRKSAKTVLITTTIRVPHFLQGVLENAITHQAENVSVLVIGDLKTPPEVRSFCRALSHLFRIPVTYLDVPDQEQALAAYPELLALIPKNSAARILLGNFLAYQSGAESIIVMLDDDFVSEGDFFGTHRLVGAEREVNLIRSPSGWFNAYEATIEERGIPFYFRGFPWSKRTIKPGERTMTKRRARVMVNQGLVMEDPDVDAVTRLAWPIRAIKMHPAFGQGFGLEPGTWCPFNIENVALAREIIPLYFMPAFLVRNNDIWASYILTRILESRGEVVSYGYPLVKQFRNAHNLWRDLGEELVNDQATDRFVEIIRAVPLEEPDYLGALGTLLDEALARLEALTDVPEEQLAMMQRFLTEYRAWHHAMKTILVPSRLASPASLPPLG